MIRKDVCSSNRPMSPTPERGHMCGKCMTPHATEGNPECPNRKDKPSRAARLATLVREAIETKENKR